MAKTAAGAVVGSVAAATVVTACDISISSFPKSIYYFWSKWCVVRVKITPFHILCLGSRTYRPSITDRVALKTQNGKDSGGGSGGKRGRSHGRDGRGRHCRRIRYHAGTGTESAGQRERQRERECVCVCSEPAILRQQPRS